MKHETIKKYHPEFIEIQYQGIIQKKSASGCRMLPCLMTFIRNFILIWKCKKWYLNRGTLVYATAIYQSKCLFMVLSALFCALFCSSRCCLIILDYSLSIGIFVKVFPDIIHKTGNFLNYIDLFKWSISCLRNKAIIRWSQHSI